MFEFICMSLLGIAYVGAVIKEKEEERIKREKERIFDLKITIFCYAVRHNLLYDKVVEMIQNKEITIDEIKKDGKE